MVVSYNFEDLFDVSSKVTSVSLPAFKETPLKIEFDKSDDDEIVYESPKIVYPFANSEVFLASIFEWRRLTAQNESCKDVYEVTFDITGNNFNFKPGDTIGVLPQNLIGEVNTILHHLGMTTNAELPYRLTVNNTIKGAKIPSHIPERSTIRYVLTHCLDIRSVVKKLFILALSKHTKDDNERKALEYICSKEGSIAYTTHVLNQNLCLIDIFSIFKTCKPPVEILFAYLPRLLPRPYSIANSQQKDMNRLKICFSVMNLKNNRKGLTTGWLENVILDTISDLENSLKNLSINEKKIKSCNNKIPIYLRKNVIGFSMPEDLKTPLLLIGPGTGVVPFISFLQERDAIRNETPELTIGAVWLFFGCRNHKLDFIYETELNGFLKSGALDKLSTAFSRVEDSEFKYVQDALLHNGEQVTKFIKNGAAIFLCGDLRMVSQIRDVLVQCFVKYDGKSLEGAEKYISDLQKDKKYIVDIWS